MKFIIRLYEPNYKYNRYISSIKFNNGYWKESLLKENAYHFTSIIEVRKTCVYNIKPFLAKNWTYIIEIIR